MSMISGFKPNENPACLWLLNTSHSKYRLIYRNLHNFISKIHFYPLDFIFARIEPTTVHWCSVFLFYPPKLGLNLWLCSACFDSYTLSPIGQITSLVVITVIWRPPRSPSNYAQSQSMYSMTVHFSKGALVCSSFLLTFLQSGHISFSCEEHRGRMVHVCGVA